MQSKKISVLYMPTPSSYGRATTPTAGVPTSAPPPHRRTSSAAPPALPSPVLDAPFPVSCVDLNELHERKSAWKPRPPLRGGAATASAPFRTASSRTSSASCQPRMPSGPACWPGVGATSGSPPRPSASSAAGTASS